MCQRKTWQKGAWEKLWASLVATGRNTALAQQIR